MSWHTPSMRSGWANIEVRRPNVREGFPVGVVEGDIVGAPVALGLPRLIVELEPTGCGVRGAGPA